MKMRRVPSIPRPESLGRSQLATTLQKLPPVRITVADFSTVDHIHIKRQSCVMTGSPAVGSASHRSHPEGISPLRQITHRTEHAGIESHIASGGSSVGTPLHSLSGGGLADVIEGGSAIVAPTHLTRQPRDLRAVLQPPRHLT